jgi:hypothetical protein
MINIKNKYYEMDSYFLPIGIGVNITSRKVGVRKKAIHFSIPSLGRFLKTIEIFIKEAHKIRVILKITKRWFHVNLFMYIPMQEGEFNIHRMDLHFM